jgi:hypothetical protein
MAQWFEDIVAQWFDVVFQRSGSMAQWFEDVVTQLKM